MITRIVKLLTDEKRKQNEKLDKMRETVQERSNKCLFNRLYTQRSFIENDDQYVRVCHRVSDGLEIPRSTLDIVELPHPHPSMIRVVMKLMRLDDYHEHFEACY